MSLELLRTGFALILNCKRIQQVQKRFFRDGCLDVFFSGAFNDLIPHSHVGIVIVLLLTEGILHHLGCTKLVNSGMNYQPQLVEDVFHQQYHY